MINFIGTREIKVITIFAQMCHFVRRKVTRNTYRIDKIY